MPICPSCGLLITQQLCPHHASSQDEQWSKENRIWCDYIHRGIPIPRLSEEDRSNVPWYGVGAEE